MAPRTLYTGVDVGKKELVVVLAASAQEALGRPRNFPNRPAGFRRLMKWVQATGVDFQGVHVCLEATGVYGQRLVHFLQKQTDWTVSVVDPAQVKAFGQAQLSRTKTDGVDAFLLAAFAAACHPRPFVPEPPELRELKALGQRLATLKNFLQEEQNRLSSLMDAVEVSPVVQRSIRQSVAQTKKQIAILQREIRKYLDRHPNLKGQVELLRSIPGIGELSAVYLLPDVRAKSSYLEVKQLVAYAGLSPAHHQSGTSVRKKSRLTKAGNRLLRKALYMPALVGIRHNPVLKALYQRLRTLGKPKKLALTACMRKLLHILYGVLKNQTPFNPAIGLKKA
jgi:transposase